MHLVHLGDLLDHFLLLCLQLRFELSFLLDELLDELIRVLTHSIDCVVFSCQLEFELAAHALLLLEPSV